MELKKEEIEKLVANLRAQAVEYAKKIQPVYELLNWRWSVDIRSPELKVPDLEDIEKVLQRNISTLAEQMLEDPKSSHQVRSGGLAVWVELGDEHALDIECGITWNYETHDYVARVF